MKRSRFVHSVLVVSLVVTHVGCAGRGAVSPVRSNKALAAELRQRGVTEASTAFVVFRGSEGSVGSDVFVKLSDSGTIHAIWDCIQSAEPTSRWAASGWLEVQFFAKQSSVARAILQVNETDAARVVEANAPAELDNLQKCYGLNALVMARLNEESVRREGQANARGVGERQQRANETRGGPPRILRNELLGNVVRKHLDAGDYNEAMRTLSEALAEWKKAEKEAGHSFEGAAGYLYSTVLFTVAEAGDSDWGDILDGPTIPYEYKTSLIFEILEARLGKGAVYVGNRENYIVPTSAPIDLDTQKLEFAKRTQ